MSRSSAQCTVKEALQKKSGRSMRHFSLYNFSFSYIYFLCLIFLSSAFSSGYVDNNDTWYDTEGNPISAHDGGISRFGDTFYWYGSNYEGNPDGWYGDKSHDLMNPFNIYSSTDLVNWKHEGVAFAIRDTGWTSQGSIHRPHVIYNDSTKKYVMYFFHFFGTTQQQMYSRAVADSPTGPFDDLVQINVSAGGSQDCNLFKDDDGTGYGVYNDRVFNLRVDKLTPDYLNVTGEVVKAVTSAHEAPAMVKFLGKYVVAGSDLEGWSNTEVTGAWADNPLGPYSAKKSMSNGESWGQITEFVYIKETNTCFGLLDDWIWGEGKDINTSRYRMLPLKKNAQGDYYLEWTNYYNPLTGDASETPVSGVTLQTPVLKIRNDNPQVELRWETTISGDSLDHFEIYRDNKHIADSKTLAFTDTSAILGEAYLYQIKAITSGSPGSSNKVSFTAMPSEAVKVDELDPPVKASANWTAYQNSSYYKGACYFSNTPQESVEFTFSGIRASFIGQKRNDLGYVSIYIDGVLQEDVDCYSSSTQYQTKLYESPILAPGEHTMKVEVKGTKSASSTGTYVIVDAFEYYSWPDSGLSIPSLSPQIRNSITFFNRNITITIPGTFYLTIRNVKGENILTASKKDFGQFLLPAKFKPGIYILEVVSEKGAYNTLKIPVY
ncbi:MAG: family 43 glycosylhydrolase [Fibrobacteria bacterium]|nr:family 43 glycosylhydrolase [Fibrobacteria bacterium]